MVLERFASGDWKTIKGKYERGDMTFKELLERGFAFVRASEELILRELEETVHFRPGFNTLLDLCRKQGTPVVVVSSGIDFCNRHLLRRNDWLERVQLHTPQATRTADGFRFSFPSTWAEGSVNLKDDCVKYYRGQGNIVAYVGDSLSDYYAIRAADLAFVIAGSALERRLKSEEVKHMAVRDFATVAEAIGNLPA